MNPPTFDSQGPCCIRDAQGSGHVYGCRHWTPRLSWLWRLTRGRWGK